MFASVHGMECAWAAAGPLAVVPVLVGPLQVLLAVLPGILVAVLGVLASLLRPAAMKQGLRLAWRLKGTLAIVLAAGVGLFYGVRAVWPVSRGSVGQAEGQDQDWPMVRGGPARLGAAPGAEGPARGGVNWVHKEGDAAFYSSPAVVGNRVYVASAELGVFGGTGTLLALDADTGTVVWRGAPDGYQATFSSPVVAGRYLVCGEGLHFTRDARVVCLDLTPGREGRVLWTHKTASHVECAPVVAGDRVYIGAGDDGYYCFDLEPGPDGRARVVWHLPGEKYPDAETALVVHEGRVYAGLGVGGRALCVLDAATGTEIKRLPTPYPVFSPPSVAGGKLYFGMGNGDYVHSAEEVRADQIAKLRQQGKGEAEIEAARRDLAPGGQVWCVDLATLAVDWRFEVPQTVLGAVAVAGDELYFGARDGGVYALDRGGRLIARWDARAPIVTSPAITDRHVYVMTAAGRLYGLKRTTLEPVWELAAGTEPLFISSPTVARGRVYVGTQADGLLCAGQPGADEGPPLWPGHLGGPGAAGNPEGSALARLGAFQWQYPPDQTGKAAEAYVTAPAAAVGGRLIVPLAAGPAKGLASLPVAGPAAGAPRPVWTCETPLGVRRSPAVSGTRVVFVDGGPGDAGRALRCVGTEDGRVAWQVPVAAEASGALAATADAVLVQDTAGGLTCLGLDGKKIWSHVVGRLEHAPAAGEAMLSAAVADPPALVAMDRPTGRVLWRVALDAPPRAAPVLENDRLYLPTARGLEARSLVDGTPAAGWTAACGGVTGDVALGRDVIVCTTDAGELVVLARADGRVRCRAAGATPGLPPVLARDAVLYMTKGGLMRLALGDAGARPGVWMDASWLGAPTAPAIVSDGRVYVGMAGWGLVCLGASR